MKPTIESIQTIHSLIAKGIEAWMEAGKLIAKELETDPDFADKFNAQHPEISVDTIYAFDRIGRKELHPQLVISDCAGAVRLRRLPYSAQEKYTKEPVRLLIRKDRDWEVLQTSVFNLTPEQAKQVFDSDHIRSESEQRAFVEDKTSRIPIAINEPFRITGKKLIVMQPCQFTSKQLANFLSQME